MNRSYGIFAEFYDSLTENVEYQKRGEYFNSIIERFGGKKGVLLDLACGTGSLSEVFDSFGYDVIGIDNSADMLCIAMNKKIEKGNNIQYVCQDMRKLDLYGNIDVTICALDSLNHLDSLSDIEAVFDGVYRFTEPGGLFIFDMNTEYKHREILGNNTFVYDKEDVYCVWQNFYENGIVSIYLDFFVPDENGMFEKFSEEFNETAYPLDDIKKLIENKGFEILGIYDEDSFEPIKANTQRAVFAVRKPR